MGGVLLGHTGFMYGLLAQQNEYGWSVGLGAGVATGVFAVGRAKTVVYEAK